MNNKYEWVSRYSINDLPDKHGRWARLCYYNGLLICWVSRFVENDTTIYKVIDFFPSINSSDPRFFDAVTNGDFDVIKKNLEDRFEKFLLIINTKT